MQNIHNGRVSSFARALESAAAGFDVDVDAVGSRGAYTGGNDLSGPKILLLSTWAAILVVLAVK